MQGRNLVKAVSTSLRRCQGLPALCNAGSEPCSAATAVAVSEKTALHPMRLQAWVRQNFRATVRLDASLEVKVQSMGESISEGTIAAILKKPGDSVEEDEPIAQIETDKVTIDLRSPQAGTVESILVKEEETISVGQLVATVALGEAKPSRSAASGDSSAPSKDKAGASEEASGKDVVQQKEPSAESSSRHEDAAGVQQPAYQPRIKFPSRTTADGRRLSSLPLTERDKLSGQPKSQKEQASPKPAADKTPPGAMRLPWYVGKERGTKLSQSAVLSDREMEMIELGGALP